MDNLDLSKMGLELERIFGSVINKIPDICHPAAIRLENENGYFDQTKDLKLEPFRKQEVFEKCVKPTLDDYRHDAVTSPTGEYINIEHRLGSVRSPSTNNSTRQPSTSRSANNSSNNDTNVNIDGRSSKSRSRVLPGGSANQVSREGGGGKSSCGGGAPLTCGRKFPLTNSKMAEVEKKLSPQQKEALRKFHMKQDLNRRYSRLCLKKSSSGDGGDTTTGSGSSGSRTSEMRRHAKQVDESKLDRIFVDSSEAAYPFANPIPECMLTNENKDNLRDIIVTSLDIEWRLLTPVRPDSEYEENFFDKLVQLHRNRYRYRLEINGGSSSSPTLATNSLPFKHTRHDVIIKNPSLQQELAVAMARSRYRRQKQRSTCISLGSRLIGRFHAHKHQHNRSRAGSMSPTAYLNIPKLTLTAGDTASSELITTRPAEDGEESFTEAEPG